MAASFIASFLIFCIIGTYTLIISGLTFTKDVWIKSLTSLSLILNGCFYYYIAAYTEVDCEILETLKDKSITEWIIRIINQSLLFSLWFLLVHKWLLFCLGLFSLYVTYLIWDFTVWRYLKKHKIFYLDIAGLITTIIFIISGTVLTNKMSNLPDSTFSLFRYYFLLGMSTLAYLVIFVVGVFSIKFNPFEYLNRPNIR